MLRSTLRRHEEVAQEAAVPGPGAGEGRERLQALTAAPPIRTRRDWEVQPKEITEVINGKRYRTAGATLLANDAYWDGHSNERVGRNTFLFRTPKGAYFMLLQTTWPREKDVLSPLARDEALRVYEELPVKDVDLEEAFPGIEIEDA